MGMLAKTTLLAGFRASYPSQPLFQRDELGAKTIIEFHHILPMGHDYANGLWKISVEFTPYERPKRTTKKTRKNEARKGKKRKPSYSLAHEYTG